MPYETVNYFLLTITASGTWDDEMEPPGMDGRGSMANYKCSTYYSSLYTYRMYISNNVTFGISKVVRYAGLSQRNHDNTNFQMY